jgi:Spy/CpxP family protein refolding chaperone
MSKTFAIVATAALLVSATAFAQDPAPSSDSSAPAASAPSDSSASGDTSAPKGHKHHGHGMKSAKNGSTDHDADKLNACMSNATPTDQQEQCLKQASNS